MRLHLAPEATVPFQGDSITAAGRGGPCGELGDGYARMSADLLRTRHPDSRLTVLNRGISGHRARDLRARWQADAVDLKPDLVSVMVGVNDTWRRFDSGEPTTAEAYEEDYRFLLARLRETSGAQLLLVEPFLVPVTPEQWQWRADLDPRIHVVRRLAEEFDAALLAADGLLNQAARAEGDPARVAADGVHPTPPRPPRPGRGLDGPGRRRLNGPRSSRPCSTPPRRGWTATTHAAATGATRTPRSLTLPTHGDRCCQDRTGGFPWRPPGYSIPAAVRPVPPRPGAEEGRHRHGSAGRRREPADRGTPRRHGLHRAHRRPGG